MLFHHESRARSYLADLPLKKAFYHRNEFRRAFPHVTAKLPAIFLERDGILELKLGSDETELCEDLDQLISVVDERFGAISNSRATHQQFS